jgi:hypothetical protein
VDQTLKERAFKTSIKNTANTQVVAFGGKLLTFLKPACLIAWTPAMSWETRRLFVLILDTVSNMEV